MAWHSKPHKLVHENLSVLLVYELSTRLDGREHESHYVYVCVVGSMKYIGVWGRGDGKFTVQT